MRLPLYQVDAFASRPFEGNPAAICPLDNWLPDALMQSIAAENNLSETAFFVTTGKGFHIRWFTPTHEVDLCGHATLASAYVIFNMLGCKQDEIGLESRSGILTVRQEGEWLEMDFPAQPARSCETPQAILDAFGGLPCQCLMSEDYIVVFDHEEDVLHARPDLKSLESLDLRGVAITAPSEQYDFVTRFFAPRYGIDEDPVTGSAFTQLVPYWSDRLGKVRLNAKQVSQRGGEVRCEFAGERVKISGRAARYMEGAIDIPDTGN